MQNENEKCSIRHSIIGGEVAAVDMLKVLIAEGSDAVWKKLEEWYRDQFLNGPLEEEFIDAETI